MQYSITSETVGLAIGSLLETANDLPEALKQARQMYETGSMNVSIKDDAGHKIDGDELVTCLTGKKIISEDLEIS